jgi:8-oxo-dGTP diphosphatase
MPAHQANKGYNKAMTKPLIAKDVYGKEYEVTADQLQWRPSAYAIVIKADALLVSPQFGGYDLPGGGIDLGETPEEAALREVKEETGITAANPRLVACHSTLFKMPDEYDIGFIQSIMLYYVCDYVGGELSDTNFTEEEKQTSSFPAWLPIHEQKKDFSNVSLGSTADWRPIVSGHLRSL